MQIYSKSTKNATSPLFTEINAIPQICTSGGDVYYASRNYFIHLFCVERSDLEKCDLKLVLNHQPCFLKPVEDESQVYSGGVYERCVL